MNNNQHFKELVKTIKTFGYKYDIANVFEDFLTLTACSISNSVNKARWEEREGKYMSVIGKYTQEEANKFAVMLALLVEALEYEPDDYLGRLYMELELFNKWKGQYFTSCSVAKLMAQVSIIDDQTIEKAKRGEVVSIYDCCAGGGVMLIAAYSILKDEVGINPQKSVRFYAGDIDIKAVLMTYIQLSLLGAHATVWHMNSLTLEHFDTWLSPFYFLGGGQGEYVQETPKDEPVVEPSMLVELVPDVTVTYEQLSLFQI